MGAAAANPLLLPLLHTFLCRLTASVQLVPNLFSRIADAVAALLVDPLSRVPAPRGEEEAEEEEEEDEAGDNHAQCAVCLSLLRQGEASSSLWCGHVFHGSCLHRWVAHHRSTCPLCRAYLLLPQHEPAPSAVETIVVAAFTFSGAEDSGNWWLR